LTHLLQVVVVAEVELHFVQAVVEVVLERPLEAEEER